PKSSLPPIQKIPLGVFPKLTAGGYVFPVYGPASYTDTFGAPRADTGWHHGEDIFASLGAPILAVASGTVYSVGWNDIGGLRLWLQDRGGNEFYYPPLSASSALAGAARDSLATPETPNTPPITCTSRSPPPRCSTRAMTAPLRPIRT